MEKRTRQGLGLALLGVAVCAAAFVVAALVDGSSSTGVVALVNLMALAGGITALVGLVVAGVSLLRP